ncbi:MAG: hypothetical protein SGBAC_001214 [Bacillariaceae sp.]
MEIYRDVDVNVHTEGHRAHRTRKPLTPHNRQTPMQAFRRSLKTTATKEVHEQGALSTNPTKSATKNVVFVQSTETENGLSEPTSTQSFRQSLRTRSGGSKLLATRCLRSPRGGVLSSRFATDGSAGKSTFSALGPPQRVVPKTPNSILRSEMGGDDSMEEESFLVSPPPDALWNRLETSTTGLLVVSPQVATEIHETLSARKLKQESGQKLEETSLLFSPPLRPRKLATSTAKKTSYRKAASPFSSANSASSAKSPWFSLEATDSVACYTPVVRTAPPPNVKTLTLRSTDEDHIHGENSSINQSVLAKVETIVPPDSVSTPGETPTEEETGLMNFSHMFSTSKKAATGPSAHLLDRLQHRSIRSPNDSVGATKPEERQKRAVPKLQSVEKEPSTKNTRFPTKNPPIALSQSQDRKIVEETETPKSEAKTKETGLMDFSSLFSTSKTKRSPPSHLVERLQKKLSPKPRARNPEKTTKRSGVAKSRSVKKSTPTGVTSKNFLKGISDTKKMPRNSSTSSLLATRHRKSKGGTNSRNIDEKAQRVLVETTNTRVARSAQKNKLPQHHQSMPTGSPRSSIFDSKHRTRGASSQITKTETIGRMSGKYAAMATPKHGTTIVTASDRRRANPVVSPTSSNESHVHDWAEKQSNTFVKWINYTMSPGETEEEKELEEIGRSPSCAGLRMLLVHRQQSQLRLKASGVFNGDHMGRIKSTIHAEIGKGRLSIRSDRDLFYDLTLRRQVTTLLQSYAAPWLRLGLEVMYGESISNCNVTVELTKAQSSQMRSALGKFIVNRFLSDASVLKKYTKGKCKIPSGRFEKQFQAEMRSLVLYRIMVLVFFLDQAKKCNILDDVPRLFVKGSQAKSSREVLLAFCRICLSSEGDFIKHLSRIGLKVTYKQDPVDELDLSVRNLATDLRDGTCLTRLTEITTAQPAKQLMSTLRLPSISRLQKLHNLNLALNSLRERGVIVPRDVNAHHIVDGHREMVLKVMWSIIAHSCMGKLLEDDLVEKEIESVKRSNLIRLDEIMPTSTDDENLSPENVARNERMNSMLASKRASELGGIPRMLPYCDSMNPPDEQSMLLCLTYLCSRLMESSKEIFASILIQQCYRKYNEMMLLKRKREAALIIFRVWKRYKDTYFNSQRRRYSRSVAVVEAFALTNWESLLRLKTVRLQKERMLFAVQLIQVGVDILNSVLCHLKSD